MTRMLDKKMAVVVFIAIFALIGAFMLVPRCCTFATSGHVYYVAADGDNSWTGTESKPFKTLKYAVSRLEAGDTLYIKGGTYGKVTLDDRVRGTKDAYITICNAPGESPVISGGGSKAVLMDIEGASYVKVKGLEFADADGQDSCGIYVGAGSSHLVISGNRFHDITVPRPAVEDHCANCILLFGDSGSKSINHVTISGNQFYDCETGWAECVSVTGNATSVKVNLNDINNTGNIGIDFSGNYGYCKKASVDFPRNCEAKNNTVTNCVSKYATSYGIYVDGGQKIKLSGNVVSKCSGGIEIGAEQKPQKYAYSTRYIRVTGNIVSENLENGITVGGYEKKLGWVRNVTVDKNQCLNNGKDKEQAILTLSKCNGVKVTNNAFSNSKIRCAIVYSEFSTKYTRKISFAGNRFYNGGGENSASFVWRNKVYTSFAKWNRAVGGNAGKYGK